MRKTITWIVIVSFAGLISPVNTAGLYAQQASKTVAVLDIDAKGGISKGEATTLSDRLRTELVGLNVLTVLERGQMEAILTEQGFNQSGCTSSECIVEAGRLLGVQQMIAGDVGKIGNVLTIDIRVFDVANGKIVRAYKNDYRGEVSGLLGVMSDIARDIAGLKRTKQGSLTWLWLTMGAIVIGGGVAALLLGGSDGDTNSETSSLADPVWPPQ